jgi:hypothetical protein
MDSQAPAKKLTAVLALLIAAMGGSYILFATGIIAPGHQHLTEGERWFTIAFGSTFLLGGTAVIIQLLAGGFDATTGELPAAAPFWLRWIYRAMVVAIVMLMASMFSWVAFGPGERQFTSSLPFTGETGGRIAFGIGALLMWLALAVIGFIKARRLLQRRCGEALSAVVGAPFFLSGWRRKRMSAPARLGIPGQKSGPFRY